MADQKLNGWKEQLRNKRQVLRNQLPLFILYWIIFVVEILFAAIISIAAAAWLFGMPFQSLPRQWYPTIFLLIWMFTVLPLVGRVRWLEVRAFPLMLLNALFIAAFPFVLWFMETAQAVPELTSRDILEMILASLGIALIQGGVAFAYRAILKRCELRATSEPTPGLGSTKG